jgi:hypothetical protein
MKNKKVYNQWTEFINDDNYKKYFISNEELWYKIFNKVKLYIYTNNKLPSTINKNKEVKQFGQWLHNQKQNYKTKIRIMSNEEIYNKWTEFINDDKYKQYFLVNT